MILAKGHLSKTSHLPFWVILTNFPNLTLQENESPYFGRGRGRGRLLQDQRREKENRKQNFKQHRGSGQWGGSEKLWIPSNPFRFVRSSPRPSVSVSSLSLSRVFNGCSMDLGLSGEKWYCGLWLNFEMLVAFGAWIFREWVSQITPSCFFVFNEQNLKLGRGGFYFIC